MLSQISQKEAENAVGIGNVNTKVTQADVPGCSTVSEQQQPASAAAAVVTMALPPSNGDEDSCTHKDSRKRMVHNEVERRRKVKITNYIANLAKLLPNKDGRKWSKNETLQKAVDYIKEVKEAHEKMLLGKVDEVQALEMTRLKKRIEELEQQNSNYVKLFTLAGISPETDPSTFESQPKGNIIKIDPKAVVMGENGDVVLLSPTSVSKQNDDVGKTKTSTNVKCKTSSSSPKKHKRTTSGLKKEHTARNSGGTPTSDSNSSSPQNKATEAMTLLPNASTTTWVPQMAEASSSSTCAASTLPVATHETLITQATNCVTAVTQTLPGGPIMSTSQSSTLIQQQQQATTVMSQLPLLNFGAPVSVMQTTSVQPVITINEQGIPVLQMMTPQPPGPHHHHHHHQQLGNGQVIVNGHPTQNHHLLLTRDSPTATLECQAAAGHTQGIIQTEAGIFQQAMSQIIGSSTAARYMPHHHQHHQLTPSANTTNGPPQMQLVAPANVMLGTQGSHQQGSTMLTVNPATSSNSSNLPSALMLPNGQIIPVVREPSILYSNSAPINGNILMTAAAPAVSQAMLSSSHLTQQHQTNVAAAAQSIQNLGIDPGTAATAVHMPSSQAREDATLAPLNIVNALPSSMLPEMLPCNNVPQQQHQATPPRPLSTSSSSTPDLTVSPQDSNGGMPTVVTSQASSSSAASKKSVTARRAHRAIKPKPPPPPSSLASVSQSTTGTATCAAVSGAATKTKKKNATDMAATSKSRPVAPVSKSAEVATDAGRAKRDIRGKRPTSMVTDILAQATESIFANSASDTASPTSIFAIANGGDDCLQNGHASPSLVQQQQPDSLSVDGKSVNEPGSENTNQQTVDILSDLVCEVYGTSSVSPVTAAVAPSTIESPDCAIIGSRTDVVTSSSTPGPPSSSSGISSMSSSSVDLVMEESTAPPLMLNPPPPPIAAVPFVEHTADVVVTGDSESEHQRSKKRSCNYNDDEPSSKRLRQEEDDDVAMESLLNQSSSLSGKVTTEASPVKVGAAGGDDDLSHHQVDDTSTALHASPVSDASPSGASTTSSSGVSFVSISQLASSSSSSVANSSGTGTSCSVTYSSSMAATSVAASFSIDTAISNVSSPLCSISPLLSSPNNKSNDLTFSLGAAISDLARSSDEAATSLDGAAYVVPGYAAPTATAASPNFGLHDLGSTMQQVVVANSFRPTYPVRDFAAEMTDGPVMDKQQQQPKEHSSSMHYVRQTGNLHQQQHIVPPAAIFAHHHHHQHHPRGPVVVGSDHSFQPPSAITSSQVPSFCQGYSTPLTHHHSGSGEVLARSSTLGHQHGGDGSGHNNKANKSSSAVHQRRLSMNSNIEVGGIVSSPPGVQQQQMQRSQSVHLGPAVDGSQQPMSSHHRHTPNYVATTSTRLHPPLNHHQQSPQGNIGGGNNSHSPKMPNAEIHGHSPMGGGGPLSSTSPKPGMPGRSHSAASASPGRSSSGGNALPAPPVSSPTFVPHCSPTIDIGSYSSVDGMTPSQQQHHAFRDLGGASQKQRLNHQQQPPPSSSSPMNNNSRTTISYSAESLIQTQPTARHRPNCAREGHNNIVVVPPPSMGRNTLSSSAATGQSFLQQQHQQLQAPSRVVSSSSNSESAPPSSSFAYFGLPPSSANNDQIACMGMPLKHAGATSSAHVNVASGAGKQCVVPPPPQTQPNFSFSLMQHAPPPNVLGGDAQQHQRVPPQGPQDNFRHNNYFNYGGQMGAPPPMTGLQCGPSASKNAQGNPAFHHHHHHHPPPPPSFPNQQPGGVNQMQNVGPRGGQVLSAAANAFVPDGGSFAETSPYQMLAAAATVPSKGSHYKSKGGGKQESSTKTSKSKQQNSRKKHHQQQQQQQQQYTMEEVNLSNSIFETGRSMTPYFSISNLSPPRNNEAPTYIPTNTNPLFNTATQRGTVAPPTATAAGTVQQSKTTEGHPAYNPLFTPRNQGGGTATLNLNFQATSGFSVNHLHHHGNGGTNQISSHAATAPPHVPNFNLSNIFPDINGSSDSLNISPIKFHHPGNHILPPTHQTSTGMVDHNLQHHQSAGPLYHNRGHHPPPPPPSIHNGMTINSLLGHNPHGFDGRSQVAMGINNTMTPPFHGHGHTATFSNVIPTLNFSMHDH